MKFLHLTLTALAGLVLATNGSASITGQWDFESSDLTATVGSALTYRDTTAGGTQFGTTTTFGIAGINGQPAKVMKFPATTASQGYVMPHGAAANGGGTNVNQYTLIMDILFPAASSGYGAFLQSDTGNTTNNDAELFVNPSPANGIGISGQYQGNLTTDVWHRIAFTVDLTKRELGKFIDGTNVVASPVGAAPLGTNPVQYLDATVGVVDQRWSLGTTALLFADNNNETRIGYVSSIQFHNSVLAPAQITALGGAQAGGIPTNTPPPIAPGTIAQYDFNGDLSSSVGGSILTTDFAAPALSAGVTFSPAVAGSLSGQAASLTRGTFLRMNHGLGANGGGTLLNQYTLIMDVNFPSRPNNWNVFYQSNTNNTEDGEWFVNSAGGVGISANYGGNVPTNTWNRCAVVVDQVAGTFTSFINGVQVQQNTGLSLDGRWGLSPQVLLFADENQENSPVLVNSVQLRPYVMIASDLATLGSATAAGIPFPIPPTIQITSPNGGQVWQAGTTNTITWTSTHPSGSVRVDVYRGGFFLGTLATVPMINGSYAWAISPTIGDTNTYRVRVTSLSYASVFDDSDANFTITGSSGGSPLFGQPLQANGGFETLFGSWTIIEGSPLVLDNTGGKGSPHGGAWFFHGGKNTSATNAIVRQEIDLVAAGFTTSNLDSGAALDTEVWLRNWYGAGTFDDQVFCRVAYLDATTNEIAAVRCMIAANNAWLQRNLSGLLPAGTRQLRVEIIGRHRRDLDNDSMADDVVVRLQQPFPLPQPTITKLPMLQDVRTNAMRLFWETDGNLVRHYVDWGRSNINEHTFTNIETLQIDSTHFVHRATLPGLETETSYTYRVRSGTNVTSSFTFTTAPQRDSPFITAWWGDNHGGTVTLATHVTNLMSQGPNMICVAGDMVNSGNNISEWHNYWFKPLETLNAAQTTPVIYARGNHDGEHALAYAYSALPGNEAWFAFDYGNSRFIFLDSEVSTATEIAQFNWLSAELNRPETQKAAFRIVCFHRPPFVNWWNGGGYTGEGFAQVDWVPLFAQKNVDFVIGGHMHAYQRGITNGVMYVVCGGGGGTIDTQRVASWPFVTAEFTQYHFGLMTVNDNKMTWEVFGANNLLLDTFALTSRVPKISKPAAAGGSLPIVVTGKPSTTYVTETSPNLQTWTPFFTNVVPAAGNPTFTNLFPVGSGALFIRARTTN